MGDGNIDVGACMRPLPCIRVAHCLCAPRVGEGGQLLGLDLTSCLTAPVFFPHRLRHLHFLHHLVHDLVHDLVHHFLPTLSQAIEWALAHLDEEDAKNDAHHR